jgi:hypothetical protein
MRKLCLVREKLAFEFDKPKHGNIMLGQELREMFFCRSVSRRGNTVGRWDTKKYWVFTGY